MNRNNSTTITNRLKRAAGLWLVLVFAFAIQLAAHGGFDHVIGTVVKVENNVLTVKTAKGNVEVRLNAEDPARGFAPSPGVVERFRPPLGAGVRLDTHVEEGAIIPPYYDSLIAKLIVWDESRPAAIERCLRALGELDIRGVATTRDVALEIVASEEFRSGRYSTSFLEETALAAVGAA